MIDKLNADTQRHIDRVRRLIRLLLMRAESHDQSKFSPKLSTCKYGSEEYWSHLAAMRPAKVTAAEAARRLQKLFGLEKK